MKKEEEKLEQTIKKHKIDQEQLISKNNKKATKTPKKESTLKKKKEIVRKKEIKKEQINKTSD